jgi:predicted N-acetyltransferase YhbS
LPQAYGLGPGISIRIESALDERQVDQIFREAVFLQDTFHKRDIFLRPGEPGNEFISNGRLKKLDELLHFVIDDDGDIEFGVLFTPISRKDLQVEIVIGFITGRKR